MTATAETAETTLAGNRRWLALYVLCLGDVLIVLDSTIVNVALPSIQADLGFSDASLAWVVNAYLLTFGGFLLLGGRLSDLFGRRRAAPHRPGALHRSYRSPAVWPARRSSWWPLAPCRASAAPSSRWSPFP